MFDALLTTTQTITANGAGTAIEVDKCHDCKVNLFISNVSGTTPTLDIKLQGSVDGTTYVDICSLPQVTQAEIIEGITLDMGKYKYFQPAYTVGGTTPSFSVAVRLN